MIIEKIKSIEEFQTIEEIERISLKEWKKLEKENLELYFKLKSILYEYRIHRNSSKIIDKYFRREIKIFRDEEGNIKFIKKENDEGMRERYEEEMRGNEWNKR